MGKKLMLLKRTRLYVAAIAALCAGIAACDKDPTQPTTVLALVACPAGLQAVNSPILLNFSQPLLPAAVTAGNIVVTDAKSGFEIPGSVRISATDPKQVVFTPTAPFPFDTAVRVRVQNLLPQGTGTPLSVTVCNLRTELPPIRELYWRALPSASGNDLLGVSLVEPAFAYVSARSNTLYRYSNTTSVTSVPLPVYYSSSADVSFVSRDHGFAIATQFRTNQTFVIETIDGAVTFDTVGSVSNTGYNRIYFRPIPDAQNPFGVAAGGATFSAAIFSKYHPATHSLTTTTFSSAGGISDVDFTRDTLHGAASASGAKIGTRSVLGALFQTTDGGTTWSEVTNARAPDSVVTYNGVAVKSSGEIFVVGANGYVGRFTPDGTGSYTRSEVTLPITNPTPGKLLGLQFTDVQFAPTDDKLGWIIGSQQSGVVNGVPRYQGVIFMTRDGGTTWTRQGIRGADNYGAEFPALTRLDVLSTTAVWAVGVGGTVIRYAGPAAP